MKVLRSTMYPPSIDDFITVVGSERSFTEPVERVAAEMERPGAFVVSDIYEVPDTQGEPRLSLDGAIRQAERAEVERNMAISYYWNAAQLGMLAEGGILANPRPAPLSVEQISVVLRQLHKHPAYRAQTVACLSEDYRLVRLYPTGRIDVLP